MTEPQSEQENIDRVWELAQSIKFCMLASWDGERQQARPMTSRIYRDRHAIYFLDQADSAKEQEIKQFPRVALIYANPAAHKYLSISGLASVSNDRALIKELWTIFDKAWWKSDQDPDIRVIKVVPDEAELWDSPNKLVAVTIMLTAALTGIKPDMGTNAKVAI